MAKILVIGCGAIGYALATTLADAGHKVTGVKRNLPPTPPKNFALLRADITSPADVATITCDYEQIFFIVSADGRNESSYKDVYETGLDNLLQHFTKANCQAPWFFVSSTSVYGQTQGEWVDENSATQPDKLTSQLIVKAEQKLLAQNPANVVVRFSGIYGPGREYLVRMAQQSPSIQQNPPYYTNRIHQDDCVNVLAFLLAQRLVGIQLEACYLASDNDPAPMWDVISWMANQLHCNPPESKAVAEGCDMNKRCRNNRLKHLGYRFLYPDYKAGYLPVLQAIVSAIKT